MKIASKKVRDSARGKDCTVRMPGICSFDPATTVLAHIPCGQKGVGMKGFDTVAVYACANCHDVIDGRRMGQVDWQDIPRAIAETHQSLVGAGLVVVKGAAA